VVLQLDFESAVVEVLAKRSKAAVSFVGTAVFFIGALAIRAGQNGRR
jgi:hypothetical protein